MASMDFVLLYRDVVGFMTTAIVMALGAFLVRSCWKVAETQTQPKVVRSLQSANEEWVRGKHDLVPAHKADAVSLSDLVDLSLQLAFYAATTKLSSSLMKVMDCLTTVGAVLTSMKLSLTACIPGRSPPLDKIEPFKRPHHAKELQLRILTHNIRFAKSPPAAGEREWEERRPLIAAQFNHQTRLLASPEGPSAFICLQEVLHRQLVDVKTDLNAACMGHGQAWDHIGVGRDDGKTEGEYSPILYQTSHFELLHSATIWLSPTPDRPSKGWDAESLRIMTIGVFKHRASQVTLVVCNTHLDNRGSLSRLNAVHVILAEIRRIRTKWSSSSFGEPAVILAGDFNSLPWQEAYLAMQASSEMGDVHSFVRPEKRYGDEITYTGFVPGENEDEKGRIDFIWLGPRVANQSDKEDAHDDVQPVWNVDGYAVLPNKFDRGVYSSDHRCVVTDLRLSYLQKDLETTRPQ